jgi:hypothetical protein
LITQTTWRVEQAEQIGTLTQVVVVVVVGFFSLFTRRHFLGRNYPVWVE